MSRLTWVQPPDLVAHELVASAHEGKDVRDVRDRWAAAGGQVEAPAGGFALRGDDTLRRLAEELLDELDALPVPEGLAGAEPTDLTSIERSWPTAPGVTLEARAEHDRVHGAWLGRAVGCLLGKPVEKIPREGIAEILRSQDRWPLTSYFTAHGLPADVAARWPWNRRSAPTSLVENIDGMPEDDDLNFALVALRLLEQHGRTFTSDDVATAWLADLPAGRVFTAERVAYRNLLLGEEPPRTATRHNPFREWIGAQIRSDVYGWACPGDPAAAARLAWRDAVVSHVGPGVHGSMFVAALCAEALVNDDVDEVLEAGLSVVPPGGRYATAVRRGIEIAGSGVDLETGLDAVHADYGHLHWVHVLNNACLVAFALARSGGDFSDAICSVVTGGWDTDSNGATVGSVCGALTGAPALAPGWTDPLRNRLSSSLPGFDGIGFDTLSDRTLAVTTL